MLFRSVEDLSNIWEYTYDICSEKQADLYYEMLINTCKELAENPNLGKNYEKITKKLYGYRISKHVIFYRIIPTEEIEIIRILHGNMNLKSRIHE